MKLPYKRVVELRLVEPELSTEHLSAYYIGFIACGLSYILFVLLAVFRFFCYHRSTHLIYNFTMAKVSAAKVRRKIEMRNTISTAFRIAYVGYFADSDALQVQLHQDVTSLIGITFERNLLETQFAV